MWDRNVEATTQRKTHISTANTAAGRANAGFDSDRQGNTGIRRQKNYINFQYFSNRILVISYNAHRVY
jgi:hypothetical protein